MHKKTRTRKEVKEILTRHMPESEAERAVAAVEENARDGEYMRALGVSAAVAIRDIVFIRAKKPTTAALMEAVLSDCVGFTFESVARACGVSGQAARSLLWTAAGHCPWLAAILSDKVRRSMRRSDPPGKGPVRDRSNAGCVCQLDQNTKPGSRDQVHLDHA